MTELVDATRRRAATENLDVSVAMSAGAGAGKTSVLVQRVTNLLATGVSPARVAAVTFTERAAAEIAERVRDALETALDGASGDRRETLVRVLGSFHHVTISTVHSFCRDLLRYEALSAGWAPSTEILAESLAPSAVDVEYRRWRRGFVRRHPETAAAMQRHVTESALRVAALELLECRDLSPRVRQGRVDWTSAFDALLIVHDALRAAEKRCTNPDGCKLYQSNVALLERLARVRPRGAEAVPDLLQDPPSSSASYGRKGDWTGDGKEEFKAAVKAFEAWRETHGPGVLEPLHAVVVRDLVEQFLPAVKDAKLDANQADFQDLLVRAGALLESDGGARSRLANRFDAILVDEVQDTDPVQSRVVSLLAREPLAVGPWDAHPPRPGRLFVVGDPKQSIYRFRGADVDQWQQLDALVGRGGQTLDLQQNFRSVPGVLNFVNHCFEDLPGFVSLHPYRAAAALPPVVVVDADEAGQGIGEVEATVRYLSDLRSTDAQVVDRDTGRLRAMRWRDVMILLLSWSPAESFQDRLLAAGIPAVVEGGRHFFGRDEVRLCRAALRCLEEPGDGEAVVMVLRGIFGLSLEALARHRRDGGGWRYTLEQPAGEVARALTVLAGLHRGRGRRSWSRILDELLEEAGALSVWSLLPRSAAMLANVEKVKTLLRQFEAVASTPGEVVRGLEGLVREPDEDLPYVDPETDAVRITSVFKAKGAEAPVVVLPHLHRKRQKPTRIYDRPRGEVLVRISKLLPPGWAQAEERETAEDDAERRRWMYVAATRARDQLVLVVGEPARNDKGSCLVPDLVRGVPETSQEDGATTLVGGTSVLWRYGSSLPEAPECVEAFPDLDAEMRALLSTPAATDGALEAWSEENVAALREARRASSRHRSVSQLARKRSRGKWTGKGKPGAARRGTLIHRAMEHLDLGEPREVLRTAVPELVGGLARLEGLSDDDRDECTTAVLELLNHEVIARAAAAPERWAEVPFSYPDRGMIVSGTIDLVFPVDDARRSWVVVDWKSHIPPPSDPRRAIYADQLARYARALVKSLTGVTPDDVEAVLAGPSPQVLAEVREEEMALVHPELVGVLGSLLADDVPFPAVGMELGEPVLAEAEFAWETDDRRICLLLEPDAGAVSALEASGWLVLVVDSNDGGWVAEAERVLRDAFGLPGQVEEEA